VNETDLSPPNAEVKNEWCYISTPPYAFKACTDRGLAWKGRKAGGVAAQGGRAKRVAKISIKIKKTTDFLRFISFKLSCERKFSK
jgi:hypothetical protein